MATNPISVHTGAQDAPASGYPLREPCPAQRERSGAISLLLAEVTRTQGDRAAFVNADAGTEVTWADVAAAAELWKERFGYPAPQGRGGQAAGARPEVGRPVVGLRIAAPDVFCREYLAAVAAGVCIVPVDPRCTQGELDRYAASFRLTHLLSDGAEVLDLGAARQVARTQVAGLRGLVSPSEPPGARCHRGARRVDRLLGPSA